MYKIKLVAIILLLPFLLNAQKNIDLFIWAGQSNAQGWTGNAAYYPTDTASLDQSILLNWTFFGKEDSNGEWITMQAQKGRYPAGHFGPEVSFARELRKAGYNPAIFKYCLGGTGLARDWKAPGKGGIYDSMVKDLKPAIKKLKKQGHKVNIRGFIWIQGESDGVNDEIANAYYSNLETLLHDLRTNVVKDSELQVILGVDEQHSYMKDRPVVVKAQKKIAQEDKNIIYTSMYGLPKADATHLTPNGLVQHGCRIFNAFNLLNAGPESTIKHTGNLKVLTYNIWNGFDWGKDEPRRGKLQQWVNTQQPDVVALQELCKYTPEKLAEDAKSWGHNYSVLLKEDGYSVGLTSRYPIAVKEKIREGMHHGALHCATSDIDFFVVHLHPGSIKRRREEAKILLTKLEEIKGGGAEYIVLGDFNAHSPFDADLYEPEGHFLNRLKEMNKDKGLNGNVELNGNLDYAVLASFLSHPLYDVVRDYTSGLEERGSFPGRVLAPVNNETNEQLMSRMERIDYILVSPGLSTKCVNAKVCNGADNWLLSDHYPVIAEFE
uniref:sialate O-acetylesterase n=1 Tax=uncultured Draconibacterium sp. TaxID=1573823 RepID=UPI0032165E5A